MPKLQGKPRKAFDGRTKGVMNMLKKKGWTYKMLAAKFYCSVSTVKRYCGVKA
jgi:DNA-binding NarL/FixJ family response regulator